MIEHGKFCIIGHDIHKLVSITKPEEECNFAWLIHQEGNKYWVPVPDEKKDPNKFKDYQQFIYMRPYPRKEIVYDRRDWNDADWDRGYKE